MCERRSILILKAKALPPNTTKLSTGKNYIIQRHQVTRPERGTKFTALKWNIRENPMWIIFWESQKFEYLDQIWTCNLPIN